MGNGGRIDEVFVGLWSVMRGSEDDGKMEGIVYVMKSEEMKGVEVGVEVGEEDRCVFVMWVEVVIGVDGWERCVEFGGWGGV